MDYTYKLPRGTAAAVLSFMPKAAELPGSGRWQASGLSHHDTIFISIDESLPCDISRGYGRELCFIAFYSRAANPNISPFMRYGNSVCIPDDSSPEEIGLAYGVLYEIRKSVGTLETKLVGKSKAMQETRARIMKAVNCRFPVHIDGRTGTGKGIAAVAIHNCRLPNTSYTYGNGADFASSLSESKLFGHHKGAFTGATESSAGLICEANNSTLILDELENAAKIYGAHGLAWMKCENGTVSGGVSKFFQGMEGEVLSETGAKNGDVILMIAEKDWKKCCTSMGAVRSRLGADLGLIKPGFEFCWIIDFPLFEYNEDEGHWEAAHHMFSMPQTEYLDTLESDPGSVKGDLYDLVLNGYELASGSIRIHDVELQKRIFRICNIPDEVSKERFGFLLDAFRFSPPPHGGIAPGIDRLCMIIANEASIKEVIAFPKNTAALSPMDDSPSYVEDKQLEELHLRVVEDKKER